MAKFDLGRQQAADLNRLLDEGLNVEPSQRRDWLESLPATFESLKPHLRDMLLASIDGAAKDPLGTLPRIGARSEIVERASTLSEGSLVGPYRLLRMLGEGGMGSVWLAERMDGLVKRSVALKLPHGAWPRSGLADRMARERDILASLEHPHIARLYDAGLTTDGQPYLALEYVEGVTIDQYCTGSAAGALLDTAGRVRLFLQVARAVAYAHGKLVLHRDLKPANILVTREGHVRLLDFGIAKLLSDGEARETRLTQFAGRALTLDYASPEQILGEPLTVSSDVYSLGVVLFELLSGERPYRLKRDSRGALEDAIVEMDPKRPSDVARARDRRVIRGDLDAVVLKALKKSAADRYPTAHALIEDLQLWLAGRPVAAQSDGVWYRTRRFIRRNSLAVSAAGIVFVTVIGASVVSFVQARRAEAERVRAEAVKNFIVAMFERADPQSNGGQALTASELVRQASQEIMTSELDDPYARAEISRVLGTTLVRLRDIQAADRAATVGLSEARERFPADHIEVLRARLLRAQVLRYQNDFVTMRKELDEITPLLARMVDQYPRDFVAANSARTALEIESVRYDAAVASAQTVVALSEKYFGASSVEYATALRGLSQAYVFAGDAKQSLVFASRSFESLKDRYRGNTAHPDVIDSRIILARALASNGRFLQAIEHSEAAIADAIKVWGPDNTTIGFHKQQSVNFYLQAGEVKKALAAATRSFEILGATAPRGSMTHVASQNSLGRSLVAVGRAAEAEPIMEFVAAEAAKLFGATHRNTVEARALHAYTVAEAGQLPRALQLIAACQADLRQAPKTVTSFPSLIEGQIARRAGEFAAAIRLLEASIAEGSTLKEDAQRGLARIEIGLAQLQLAQPADGRESLLAGLALLEQQGHDATPVAARAQLALSQLDAAEGNRAAALQRATQVAEFWRAFDPQHPEAIRAADWLRRSQDALARRP